METQLHRPQTQFPIDVFIYKCSGCDTPMAIEADTLYFWSSIGIEQECEDCGEVFNLMELDMRRYTRQMAIGLMELDTFVHNLEPLD